ncbi:tripartite tricarboxylate transporter substrate binding protein [bacterium]|nr:MAG: tripartite tricarboxylate transporter substrate binding protein [bacterium]
MFKVKRWFGIVSLIFVMISLTGWISSVQCQDKYPTRSIDLIVPFAPGAATDLTARVTAPFLAKKWGVRINVINKSGGNTIPANVELYGAAPDGYTMMLDSQSSVSMLRAALKSLPINQLDRTFVALVSAAPYVIIVHSGSSFKNLKDLANEAKRDPQNFTWGSLGGAGMQDFGARQFFKAIGVDVTKTKPIMAAGGGPVVTLTAGGHLKMGASTSVGVLPAYKAGTVRPLGLSGKIRYPDFPEVPTFDELGYPAITCYFWTGISGPPKLPSYIVKKWNDGLQEVFKDPEFLSLLQKGGGVPFYKNDTEAREYVTKEIAEVNELWGFK